MGPGRPPALPPVDALEPQRTPLGLASAVCTAVDDPELFFEETRAAEAKVLCNGCPVASACLIYATWNEEFGVWGGATADEREALRGGAIVMDPEVRQRASDLRADLAGGMTHAAVATKWNVTVRTIERWVRAGRELNDVA